MNTASKQTKPVNNFGLGNSYFGFFAVCLLFFVVCGICSCFQGSLAKNNIDIGSITSYRDIPGITFGEIAVIEELKSERKSFSYGSLLSTETFILPDGTYAGFTFLFCELLSNLFGIPFVVEIHDWDELKSGFDKQDLDFTGELTPTPERDHI